MDPPPNVDPTIITPEAALFLAGIGRTIQTQLLYLLPHLILYGLYLSTVMAAVYTIAQRPTYSAQTFWLFGALIVTLCITTINWAYPFAVYLQDYIERVLVQNSSLSIYDRQYEFYSDRKLTLGVDLVNIWVGGLGVDSGWVFTLNDLLVSWRALAIWGPRKHRKSLHMILFLLVFLSFSFWVTAAGIQTDMMLKDNTSGYTSANNSIDSIFIISSSSLSIAANIVGTGMMGYATWQHLRESFADSRFKFNSGRVLLYFTESVTFYAVIQIIRLALALSVVPSTPAYGSLNTARTVFNAMTDIMVAMYTPAIILIVYHQLSIENTVQFSTNALVPGGGEQTVSTIRFHESAGHCSENTGLSSTQDRLPVARKVLEGCYSASDSTTGSLLGTGNITPEKRDGTERAIGRVA